MLSKNTRFKRDRFTNNRPKNHNPQTVIYLWIIGIVAVVGLILGGIKIFNHYQSRTFVSSHRVSRSANKAPRKLRAHPQKDHYGSSNHPADQRNPSADSSKRSPKELPPAFQHQHFSSIASAKAWARATQPRWLHQGYRDYRITNDGQGDYCLQFTR